MSTTMTTTMINKLINHMPHILLVIFLLFLNHAAIALPNVKFIETSVEFNGYQRSARLTLLNQGNEPANVEVKMQYKLYEDDPSKDVTVMSFVDIDRVEKTEYPYNLSLIGPNKILRFSPRRAVIQPGQRQAFRIFLKKPLDMPEGEYTVYLDVHYIKNNKLLKNQTSKTTTAIDLPIQFSYSIPLQIYHGKLTGKLTNFAINKAELLPKEKNIQEARVVLDYKYEGNASIGFALEFYADDQEEPFHAVPEIVENYRHDYKKAYLIKVKESIKNLRVVAKTTGLKKILFDVSAPVTKAH